MWCLLLASLRLVLVGVFCELSSLCRFAVVFCFLLFGVFFMKIFSWNCQGATSYRFRRALLLLVNKVKTDLVGLLELRISGFTADKAYKNFGFDNWIRVEVVGFSGGHLAHVEKEY